MVRVIKCLHVSMTDEVNPNEQPQKIFSATGLLGEEISLRSMYQQSGFSRILNENDILVCILDEEGGTVTAIASDSSDRPILSNPGDTAMYASETVFIKVLADGSVLIDNGSGTIELKANGQVDINSGNLTIDP